jgi:predicted amidophosphoribosyltransferase
MPFCPECGKPVSPKAKFCRNCGASQLDDALSAAVLTPGVIPVAAPIPSFQTPVIPDQPQKVPLPPQGRVRPVAPLLCSACGSPLSPSEKFCGICGARAGQTVPPAPSPSTPVYLSPDPLVTGMGQNPAVQTCTACGNIIKPGDKFCSRCLVIVRDNPPKAATPAPVPVKPPAAASSVCASCGSPVTGTEKFCGICGTPVAAARVPVQQQPAQKCCSACGAPVSDTTKFCGGCGAPVGASSRPPE